MLRRMKTAVLRLASRGEALPNNGVIHDAPTPQAVIDLFDNWISIAPAGAQFHTSGYAELFNDGRVRWAIDALGGVKGLDILELGPLEAGHTYMLGNAGARSILAIEAMQQSYFKCLAMKELLGLDSAHFLLGNFEPWLQQTSRRFDAIWASGVLYHSMRPVELLQLIAARTDRVFLWTHYYPEEVERPLPITNRVAVEFSGRTLTLFERSYAGVQTTSTFCGGTATHTRWMRRNDILFVLGALGFNRIEVGPEDANANGPSFCVIAERQ